MGWVRAKTAGRQWVNDEERLVQQDDKTTLIATQIQRKYNISLSHSEQQKDALQKAMEMKATNTAVTATFETSNLKDKNVTFCQNWTSICRFPLLWNVFLHSWILHMSTRDSAPLREVGYLKSAVSDSTLQWQLQRKVIGTKMTIMANTAVTGLFCLINYEFAK